MNYIIYDTEFSQPQPRLYNKNTRFRPNPVCPFEIIEIGAVKVSQKLEIKDTFSRLVKPTIYRTLSPIVTRKTGITYRDLKAGDEFRDVIKDFRNWMGKDYLLCTWSNNDVRILKRNCIYHKLEYEWANHYYDIQKYCSRYLGRPKHQAIGLKKALEMLGIDVETKLHRALEDAIYTAKIFIRIRNEDKHSIMQYNHIVPARGSRR